MIGRRSQVWFCSFVRCAHSKGVMQWIVIARMLAKQHCSLGMRASAKELCTRLSLLVRSRPNLALLCLCTLRKSHAFLCACSYLLCPFFRFLGRAHIAKDPCTHLCLSGSGYAGIPCGEAWCTSGKGVFSVSSGGWSSVLAHAGTQKSGPDRAGAAARGCSVVVESSGWGSMLARLAVNVESWCGVCDTWCAQERLTRVLCLEELALIQRCVSGRWLRTVVCNSSPDLRSKTVTNLFTSARICHASPLPRASARRRGEACGEGRNPQCVRDGHLASAL